MSSIFEEILNSKVDISNIALQDYLKDRGLKATVWKPSERVKDMQTLMGGNKSFSPGSSSMKESGEVFLNITVKSFTKISDGFEGEVVTYQPDDSINLEQNDHLTISYLNRIHKFRVDGIIETLGRLRRIKLILI